jgi:hypothetical protein
MSKGKKGNQPERELKAEVKRAASDISLYKKYFEEQFTYGILHFTAKPMP